MSLVRRWAVDWLSAGDPDVCHEILDPDYTILIGGHELAGREAYVEGTLAQLSRFPGLGLTVHELICCGDRLAVRFTEHGAAARLGWRRAAWSGIALFHSDGDRLTRCFAEEDYLARRRQLDRGECDPIEAPAPAPWNTAAVQREPEAEAIVRDWLRRGDLTGVAMDDSWLGLEAPVLLDDVSVEIDELFSAGDTVAFHACQSGRYRGGLDGVTAAPRARGAHHLAGVVRVDRDGQRVSGGRVIRDRLGLSRRLLET